MVNKDIVLFCDDITSFTAAAVKLFPKQWKLENLASVYRLGIGDQLCAARSRPVHEV